MTTETVDQAHERLGHTAPRVTPADLNANIVAEHYFSGLDGVNGAIAAETYVARYTPGEDNSDLIPLGLLTFCVLITKNGFTVVGKSAPASKENFNPELGMRFAREDAIKQLWPLMAYALKDKLGHTA